MSVKFICSVMLICMGTFNAMRSLIPTRNEKINPITLLAWATSRNGTKLISEPAHLEIINEFFHTFQQRFIGEYFAAATPQIRWELLQSHSNVYPINTVQDGWVPSMRRIVCHNYERGDNFHYNNETIFTQPPIDVYMILMRHDFVLNGESSEQNLIVLLALHQAHQDTFNFKNIITRLAAKKKWRVLQWFAHNYGHAFNWNENVKVNAQSVSYQNCLFCLVSSGDMRNNETGEQCKEIFKSIVQRTSIDIIAGNNSNSSDSIIEHLTACGYWDLSIFLLDHMKSIRIEISFEEKNQICDAIDWFLRYFEHFHLEYFIDRDGHCPVCPFGCHFDPEDTFVISGWLSLLHHDLMKGHLDRNDPQNRHASLRAFESMRKTTKALGLPLRVFDPLIVQSIYCNCNASLF